MLKFKLSTMLHDIDAVKHGESMDAPQDLPIGCTSKRIDLVSREWDSDAEFVRDCLLRGFGYKTYTDAFAIECLFPQINFTKAYGEVTA